MRRRARKSETPRIVTERKEEKETKRQLRKRRSSGNNCYHCFLSDSFNCRIVVLKEEKN